MNLFRIPVSGTKILPEQVYSFNVKSVSPIPIDVDFEVSYNETNQVSVAMVSKDMGTKCEISIGGDSVSSACLWCSSIV